MFYLVHLVAKLDLTGDASESPIFGIGASAWAILEAIGRGLLGVHGAGYATDPIWRVLATLDRRDPAAPLGTGCRRQADFRLPPAWLQAIHPAEATWLAGISNRRLHVVDTVRHYVVADVGTAWAVDDRGNRRRSRSLPQWRSRSTGQSVRLSTAATPACRRPGFAKPGVRLVATPFTRFRPAPSCAQPALPGR